MKVCEFPNCKEPAKELHYIGHRMVALCRKHHRLMHQLSDDENKKPKCFGHFFGKNRREDQACLVNPKCKWRFQCAFASGVIIPEKVIFI